MPMIKSQFNDLPSRKMKDHLQKYEITNSIYHIDNFRIEIKKSRGFIENYRTINFYAIEGKSFWKFNYIKKILIFKNRLEINWKSLTSSDIYYIPDGGEILYPKIKELYNKLFESIQYKNHSESKQEKYKKFLDIETKQIKPINKIDLLK